MIALARMLLGHALFRWERSISIAVTDAIARLAGCGCTGDDDILCDRERPDGERCGCGGHGL